MSVETDIENQVRTDFPPDEVPAVLTRLEAASSSPRIQRCIIFAARGHRWYFEYLCRMAKIDYRDVIMTAEYGAAACSDAHLYDFNLPIQSAQIATPHGMQMP